MIYDAIKNFNEQFLWEPEIKNGGSLPKFGRFIVVGMGGSNLAEELIKIWEPDLDLVSRRDYGLPALHEEILKQSLIIASSYSGNTEETIDAFEEAGQRGLARLAIATGGKLLDLAKQENVPYIQLPDTGIQPRSALGYSIKAFLKAVGDEDALRKMSDLTTSLQPADYEADGKALAGRLKNFVPVIYSSTRNEAIAYNWKIKLNETGKIPAFYNVFPELNHNEMTGFDVTDGTRELSNRFYFLLLKDGADHPKIQKRMEILQKLYGDRKLPVGVLEIAGADEFHKIFSSLILADWTAYYTATQYGVEPEQVPMVEEFKKLI